MSSHYGHEDWLGFHLGLLAEEEASQMRGHLDGCAQCRAALDEVEEMMDVVNRKLPPIESREHDPIPLTERLTRSLVTPSLVMALSLLLSAITDWAWVAGSFVPLVAGAVFVVWWLYGVVSRVEKRWSSVGEVDWRAAIASGDAERLTLFQGVRLSVLRSLSTARSRVTQVLVISGAVFIVSGAATLLGGLWAPEVAAEVASGRPMILPGGLAFGVLLGGVVWASFRLARLGRAVADFMASVMDDAGGLRPGVEG